MDICFKLLDFHKNITFGSQYPKTPNQTGEQKLDKWKGIVLGPIWFKKKQTIRREKRLEYDLG